MQPYQAESMQQTPCRTEMQENSSHKKSVVKLCRQERCTNTKILSFHKSVLWGCFCLWKEEPNVGGAETINWIKGKLMQRSLGQQREKCQQSPEGEIFESVSRSQANRGACTVKTIETTSCSPKKPCWGHPSEQHRTSWGMTELKLLLKCTQHCQGRAIFVFSFLDWLLGLLFHPSKKQHTTLGVKKQNSEGPCMCETWVFCSGHYYWFTA